MHILIAYADDERQVEVSVEVPQASTLQQALALQAAEIAELINDAPIQATGVWGKVRSPQYVLREGDRIEIYRPLKADPKQARRARVKRQPQRE